MGMEFSRRPFVGVSLKMHLDHRATLTWLSEIMALGLNAIKIDVVVLPSFTAISEAAIILGKGGIRLGAQNCFWEESGAFTGEVSPWVLREIGCTYVEIGHAERRRLFGEDDNSVARKAVAISAVGMTPIICVGELTYSNSNNAIAECIEQLRPVLGALRQEGLPVSPVVIAYEPVWAIGADQPAGARHIQSVTAGLRRQLDSYDPYSRIIYGGSAGPGLFSNLRGVDGLFLGRSALEADQFALTVNEVISRSTY